jgi:hypothetical protein
MRLARQLEIPVAAAPAVAVQIVPLTLQPTPVVAAPVVAAAHPVTPTATERFDPSASLITFREAFAMERDWIIDSHSD